MTSDPTLRASPRPGSVLVTGGAGFIGCALAERLAPLADRWVVLDNLHPQVHAVSERPAALHDAAQLVVGDVTDPAAWDSLLTGFRPDVVVHLAAETGTAQSLSESSRHGRVNVVGTTELLDGLTRAGVVPAQLVLTSSRAVYGEGTWRRADGSRFQPGARTHAQLAAGLWDFPDAEHLPNSAAETVPAPSSVYGSTKLAQEHILSSWAGSHDTSLSVLRLQNVYGVGQSLTNPYTGIVSLFSQMARGGRSIPLYEDGEITRDFVFIDDVADALVAAIASPPERFRLVDVGTGTRTTIRDLARTVADFHGAPAPHVTGQFRDGDVRHAACDITETLGALDWSPRWGLADGIAALQGWIAQQAAAEAPTSG
ncbi:NAD-dependent epimerase/dehydratase family protein [Nocardioides terrigena]|uniref:NAD-dependent epimerase/dehydratase family protein n=1 Tax=Nocardioides terrigena TaxID=424797 RepID=UPI000D30F266|nr:NAD-dependent epimerase/dehydratase family protein [Nocardioides terrigena]